jgi:hypothetical protein
MREPSWALTSLRFDIYAIFLRQPLEKEKLVSSKKKEFEYLKDLLVSFKIYFIIAKLYHVLLI